jgi:hypothetical protein
MSARFNRAAIELARFKRAGRFFVSIQRLTVLASLCNLFFTAFCSLQPSWSAGKRAASEARFGEKICLLATLFRARCCRAPWVPSPSVLARPASPSPARPVRWLRRLWLLRPRGCVAGRCLGAAGPWPVSRPGGQVPPATEGAPPAGTEGFRSYRPARPVARRVPCPHGSTAPRCHGSSLPGSAPR